MRGIGIKFIWAAILLLFPCTVHGATLDAVVGVISDLHHDQQHDSVTNSLIPMIQQYDLRQSGVTNWLGVGDLIHWSVGDAGPFADNVSDIAGAFSTYSKIFKSVSGNHDDAGVGLTALYLNGSALYPGQYWSWDIGSKWRILALEGRTNPGFTVSTTELNWLEAQLTQAATDERYVIVVAHYEIYEDVPVPEQTMTPSGTTGTVTLTSSAAGTFTTGGSINQTVYLEHGACDDDDTDCWGWLLISQCDGGAECTTGTTVTGTVTNDFVSTDPADFWSFLTQKDMVTNSASVRAKLEAASAVVKLVLNGHTHVNDTATVNGIEYRTIMSSRYWEEPGTAKAGGLLYLYDDGTWKLAGSGDQASYNWDDFYIDADNGDDDDQGGTFYQDAWQTVTKANATLAAGNTLYLVTDISGNIDLTGGDGDLITIQSYSTKRKITGNIAGEYLSINNLNVSPGYTLSMSNSTLLRVGVL